MPSPYSYQVTNVNEGKTAEQDQSYKNCIITLLIFFFLCIILISVGLPLRLYHPYDPDQQSESTKETQRPPKSHERYVEYESATRSTKYSHTTTVTEEGMEELEITSPIVKINKEYVYAGNTLLPPTEEDRSNSSTNRSTTGTSTSTESNEIHIKVSSNEYESDRQTTDGQLVSSETIDEDTSTEANVLPLTTEKYETKVLANKSTTEASTATELNESDRQTTDGQLVSSEAIDEGTSTEANISSSTTEKYETKVLTNRSTTEASTSAELNTLFSTTEGNKRNDSIDTNVTEASIQYPILSTTDDSVRNEPIKFTTTTVPDSSTRINNEVCTTGECKNLASRMLFYMNHTADPCDDFYEYACGGFEASPQVTELTLEDVAYQRILHQMQKGNNTPSSFAKYYESCIQYESTSQTERIQLAKEALSKVGHFYNETTWDKNPVNFTDLVAKLLLYNSPLLFDITPDLDEYSPKQFTLKIGPTTFSSPFDTDEMSDPCHIDQFEKEENVVDLEELYKKYIHCKNDEEKLVESNRKVFNAFGVCNVTGLINYSQCLSIMNVYIETDLVQNFLANFPSKDKIREAYLMKNYELFTVEQLQEMFKVINWTQLIKSLTKEWIQPNITVQVYFRDALAKGMESLHTLVQDGLQMNLHNALLGLYASKLYHEFVLSKHEDAKKHCIRVAANVLIQEASQLYISSFSKDELEYMNETIRSLFFNLKETLKLSVGKAKWITADGSHASLIAKIDSLQIATPYVSDYLSKKEANQVNLSSNYFENSMNLIRRYRELIYAELLTNPGEPEQIWTHYATPYQSKGLAIYGLNLIVIPFGAIDWSFKYNEDQFDYITLATAGNVIAREIAHHFDANGIYYWNGTRDTKNTLFNENMNFTEYIENQKNTYSNSKNIPLPFTGKEVIYKISELTLNERLSEAMGLRLAYDTLDRLRSSKEVDLPWLEFHFDQLFYLAYAQMHCTKSPLTSTYVSLYENEYLPSRIRIFVSASNNKLLGEAWRCPEGSRIMPSHSFSAFPYLEENKQ